MSVRLLGPVVAVLVVALAAAASIQWTQNVVTNPAATRPVSLASGTSGTTTLGSSATSASTSGATLPVITTNTIQVLKVLRGSSDWSVEVKETALAGAAGTDTMTISLVATTPTSQVLVVAGAVTQAVGPPVTLSSAGPDLQIIVGGLCVATCTFTLQILIFPVGGTSPALVYPYTLAVT
jgi:hypothetical protein